MSSLPDVPGAKQLTPLFRGGQFGDLYSATFSVGQVDVKRIVQIVRLAELDSDRREQVVGALRARTSKLLQNPLPHVSQLEDAGVLSTGDYYTVRAEPAGWFRDRIPDDSGYPLAQADFELLVEQLLTGLAGLHRVGIPYGELRLDDIQFDAGKPGNPPVLWIAGAEFGGLAYWAGNAILRTTTDGSANDSYAAQFPSGALQPSPEADLYFLGLLICQIAGGRKAIQGKTMKEKIGPIKSPAVRSLAADLLADEADNRPHNAEAALRKFQRATRRPLISTNMLLWFWAVAILGTWLWGKYWQNEYRQLEAQWNSEQEQRLPRDTDDIAARLFNRSVHVPAEKMDAWLQGQLERHPREAQTRIKDQVNAWRGKFIDKQTYRVRIHEIQTAADAQPPASWLVTIYVDGEPVTSEELTTEDVQSGKRPTLSFEWQQGQTLGILLEGSRTYAQLWMARPNYITSEHRGPYALWELHKEGQQISGDGATLRYEVIGCPGPLRELFEPLPSLSVIGSAATATPIQGE